MAQSVESMKTTRQAAATKKEFDTVGYWRSNVRLIISLLVIWFAVSYLPVLIVNQLNSINILTGFPLGYYMGSQGSLVVFVALIVYYAWRMQKLDREYGVDEE